MAFGDLPLDAPLKPNKGLEGGACNRRSCQAEPALWYNHGMHKWYCADCARDIGQDVVNHRDWELRWKPQCGHDQFETREQMDAREANRVRVDAEYVLRDEEPYPYGRFDRMNRGPYGNHPACRPKQKSSSLERMLRKTKKR